MTSLTQLFARSRSTAHPGPQLQEQARPRTVYVPTHAAASFARTVSPLSRSRIDERDELESSAGSGSGSGSTDADTGGGPHDAARKTDFTGDDYTSFLADAKSNDQAFRARWARREREREREWAASNMASLPRVKTQRDSAYYSVTSASPSSLSGSVPRKPVQVVPVVPMPVPVPAQAPSRKPSKTLGRRISEYFKPPPSEGRPTAMT